MSMDKIRKMMDFLQIDSYIIPSHNLPLPSDISDDKYRPTRVFRLHIDGRMSYLGMGGYPHKPNVEVNGIVPDQAYIDRTIIFMRDDVKCRVKEITGKSKIKNLNRLILKFKGLDFIEP